MFLFNWAIVDGARKLTQVNEKSFSFQRKFARRIKLSCWLFIFTPELKVFTTCEPDVEDFSNYCNKRFYNIANSNETLVQYLHERNVAINGILSSLKRTS
ncbi:hypothetical protein Gasu2_37820 [Galdieria sulphuraria]|nr:hypothetical protein Gasu2_37820 [Galdieria sulphuraria]